MPEPVRAHVEEWVDGIGTLAVLCAYHPSGAPSGTHDSDGSCDIRRVATVDGRDFDAYTYGERASVPTATSSPIQGVAARGRIAVRDGPDFGTLRRWTQGHKRVLYMRLNFPDDLREPQTESRARGLMAELNRWWVEVSMNTAWLTTTYTPLLTMPKPSTWYQAGSHDNVLLADARDAARAIGYDYTDHDLDIIRYKFLWEFDGQAFVGARNLWLQSDESGVLIHEVGHNLGLWHANAWVSTGESAVGPGTSSEYGDRFCAMNRSGLGHFNAQFKYKIDWLGLDYVTSFSTNGIYRIYNMENPYLTRGHC